MGSTASYSTSIASRFIAMPASTASRGPLTQQIFHAILLRRELFERVANDPEAGRLAGGIVCLCALAQPTVMTEILGVWGLVVAMILGVLRWWFFTILTWPVARLIAWKPVDYRRLLRCLGFAEAPSVLNLVGLALDASMQSWVGAAVGVWLLATATVAVRAACEVSTVRALAIAVLSFAIYLAIGVVSSVFIQTTPA